MTDSPAEAIDIEQAYFQQIKDALAIFNEGKVPEVMAACEELRRQHPDFPEAYFVLAISALELGDPGAAINLAEAAHDLDPECRDYADFLAHVLTSVGRLADGLYYAKVAVTMGPHRWFRPFAPPQLTNYFNAIANATTPTFLVDAMRAYNLHRYAKAAEAAEKALRIDSQPCEPWQVLALARLKLGDGEEALAAAGELARRRPDVASYALLARCFAAAGRHAEALACFDHTMEMGCSQEADVSLLARALDGQPAAERDPRMARLAALLPPLKPLPADAEIPPRVGRALRVGYVGGRLFVDNDLAFIEAILANHNPHRVEVRVYQTFATGDAASSRLKQNAERWTELYNLDDATAARVLKNDELDLVVDLTGLDEDSRVGMLSRRVAPLQVTLPMVASSHLPCVDAFLADEAVAPARPAEGQRAFALGGPGIAVAPPTYLKRRQRPETGGPLLGAFVDPSRVTAEVAGAWAEILRQVPDARLVLGLHQARPSAAGWIERTFGPLGVLDRVSAEPLLPAEGAQTPTATLVETVDLLLDPFPVGGGFELCEALWLGVPVVSATLRDRPAGWRSAAILAAADRAGWHVATVPAYVECAVSLIRSDLAALRAEMVAAAPSLPLFSPQAAVRRLEQVYLDITTERGKR